MSAGLRTRFVGPVERTIGISASLFMQTSSILALWYRPAQGPKVIRVFHEVPLLHDRFDETLAFVLERIPVCSWGNYGLAHA
jgi:hypothetical protein